MSVVLQGLIGRICLAYLEDVIVYSKRIVHHVPDLRAVFERIREAKLKLKPSKCSLFRSEVLYLGHVINASGTSPDPQKLRVLLNWQVPSTVREVQSYLGFVNFYGDFIASSTDLTSSLYELTVARKNNDAVQLSKIQLDAFNELKRRLCS